MATINDLVTQRQLEKFQPLLDPGEQPLRAVYMDPVAHEWCFSSAQLGKATPCPFSFDRTHAVLDEFCSGALLYEGAHIRRLGPKREGIWELKTVPPEHHSVRIFGWFYRPGILIVCLCKYKNDVSKRCASEIKFVIDFRDGLALSEPKLAKGKDYESLMQID